MGLGKLTDEVALLMGGRGDANHLRFRCPRCQTVCSMESSVASVDYLPDVAACSRCLYEIAVNPFKAHVRCECSAVVATWGLDDLRDLSELLECPKCLKLFSVSKVDFHDYFVRCSEKGCKSIYRMNLSHFESLGRESLHLNCGHEFRRTDIDGCALQNRVLCMDTATPSIALENDARIRGLQKKLREFLGIQETSVALMGYQRLELSAAGVVVETVIHIESKRT
jgi:hypothetical protein